MNSLLTIAIFFAMTLSWIPTVHAETYRWTGASGVVHFSQFPPPQGKSRIAKTPPINTFTSPAAPAPAVAALASGNTIRTPSTKPGKSHKASHGTCRQARSNLQIYESGRRVKIRQPNGEVTWLIDARRQQQIQQIKKFLHQDCP